MNTGNISGICNICGNKVLFEDTDTLRPRESFNCPVCASNSRMRLLFYTIGLFSGNRGPSNAWRENKDIRIFEASGDGRYSAYLHRVFNYINTRYDHEVIKTKDFNPNEYADLQRLHFDDGSFHMVVTTDVFEHVRLYKDALKEVYRVLKPEGVFILQIPYNHSMDHTIERLELRDDGDVNILPARYHAGNTLVYREYGRDILSAVRDAGFGVGYLAVELPRHAVPLQDIIVAARSPYLDISALVRMTIPPDDGRFMGMLRRLLGMTGPKEEIVL
ncbi:MAG: class I SAM-dependent methyltransferase [Deltaproteobacteria bacterium]|nr:class I SAM-dependent methyltransferase [Deltaproteobacteria bacterium]